MRDVEKPDWWIANEQDRVAMELPAYEPPQFSDGVYVHDVVPELERAYDCEITLLGKNVDYLDDWEVRIDDVTRFHIGRARNDSGNTIYQCPSSEFIESVEREFDG